MLNNCFHKKHNARFTNEIVQDINEDSRPMFSNPKNEVSQVIENKELGNIIEKALEKVPFDYRIVFSLREVIGFNVADTASLLDISESNVKVRLNRSWVSW